MIVTATPTATMAMMVDDVEYCCGGHDVNNADDDHSKY